MVVLGVLGIGVVGVLGWLVLELLVSVGLEGSMGLVVGLEWLVFRLVSGWLVSWWSGELCLGWMGVLDVRFSILL